MASEMEIIQFELAGMQLQEPMGLILNWIVSICCVIFYFKSTPQRQGDFSWWWKYFFLFFGLSTFFGGLGHLFFQYTGWNGKIPSWTFGLIANLFSARAMLDFKAKNRIKNILIGIIFLKFVTFTILTFNTMTFKFVSFDASISFVGFVLILGLIQFIKTKQKHWLIALFGAVILMPAAIFNGLKIDLHLWFNRQDAAHVFMILSVAIIFLASQNYSKSNK